MSRKLHIWKRLLCLLLTLAVLPITGAAAGEEGPFVLPDPLPELAFTDVPQTAWYYESVRAACALELMQGLDTETFSPSGQVALSQGVTVAVRVYEKYRGIPDESQGYDKPWYRYYVDRAKDYGILPEPLLEADMTRSATRAELSAILAAVLPAQELEPINQVTFISDYAETEPYWQSVMTLYRAGVLTGDTAGRFSPDRNIRRSELAAVLVRLVRPEYRIKMEQGDTASGMGAFVLPDPLPEIPFTDVKENQWYFPYVRCAYALDLVSGVSSQYFDPNGFVQLSQAAAVAVRIYEKYYGLPDQSQGYDSPWYSYYMDRAREYGILPETLDTASPTRHANREELAAIVCGALPETELAPLKEVQTLPDYGLGDLYWSQVRSLYEAGVLTGQDAYGTFQPNSLVRRSELATLLTRLVLPQERSDTPLEAFPYKDIETIHYGTSSQGRNLTAYRFGSGSNVMVLTFGIHGFEDSFDRDGQLLVDTANALRRELEDRFDELVRAGDWTVYVLPSLNPDGLAEGWTNNGPGRCTIASLDADGNRREKGVDLNRCFPHNYSPQYSARNYNGTAPLQALEAQYLADFTQRIQGQRHNVLIDVHGWYQQTIVEGSTQSTIFRVFDQYFPENVHTYFNTASGYYSGWAGYELRYDACLFEFPYIDDAADFHASGYQTKFINAIAELLTTYAPLQKQGVLFCVWL